MDILNNYKYKYGQEFDYSNMILFKDDSWYSIYTLEEEKDGKLICPICNNHYNKHNGRQSDCNKCKIIVVDNINSGIMYISRSQKKRLMIEKHINKNAPWKEPTRCRTSPEIEARKIKYMKDNNLGIYNKNCTQHSKENISKMLKAAARPEIRKIVEETKRKNNSGQYSEESIRKSLETRRNNGQIKRCLDKGRKTQSKYWEKDSSGNYLINTKQAINFRNNHFNPGYEYLKAFIENAWKHYKEGVATENEIKFCESGCGYFDRDAFYASDFDICSFEVNGVTESDMSLSDFVSKYDNVGSVKAYELVDENNNLIKTLDVAKTNGTIAEISWFHRTMKVAKEQRSLSEEKLMSLSDSRIRLKRRKYLEMMELYPGSKIRIKIVFCFNHSVDIGSKDEDKLYSIETQYAHDSKAEYWSP